MPDMPSAFYIPAFGFLVGTGTVIIGALWRALTAERIAKDTATKETTAALHAMASALQLHTEAIKAMQSEALKLYQTLGRYARRTGRDTG